MAKLEIFLFGSFQVQVSSPSFTRFESIDLRALLVQLSVHSIQLCPHESLAALQ
jgi:hypothetical protein